MLYRTLCVIACAILIAAPGKPQQSNQKKVKDQVEADLYNAVAREKDPLQKLSLLDNWSLKYPDTEFRQERNLHYVSSYTNLEARAVAPNAPPEILTGGEKAARTVLSTSDSLFAPEMAPGSVKPDDWAIAREEAIRQAHTVLATLASNRKDYSQAEAEFGKLLELTPDDARAAYRLGVSIVGQKQPGRYPVAIFYLARAVGFFKGPESSAAEQYLEKVYVTHHGDLSGLEEVKLAASKTWAPPPDWHIKSAGEIDEEKAASERAFAQAHPELVTWRIIREKLLAADGADYFAANLKDVEVPNLKGTVLSQPGVKELVLAVDGLKPDATLKLDVALKIRLEPGTVIGFSGVPLTWANDPYVLTLQTAAKSVAVLTPP
jgi:tetratricopeptide (TPR) repeat protein